MRKLFGLLGILAVVSMYATSAIAGPVPPVYTAGTGCSVAAGNCGESDLVPTTTAATNATIPVDWMVLDISTTAGGPYRAAWASLVGNAAYVNADINPGPPSALPPGPIVLPSTVYAYLYQPENVLDSNDPRGASMRIFTVAFNIDLDDLIAAGVLFSNNGSAGVPLPGSPQRVPDALKGTLNKTDNFGGKVDDLDRDSLYHPGHIANSCTGGAAMCDDTAAKGGVHEDGVPPSGLEEEGTLPTDIACPGPVPSGDFVDPGEFCEAAGLIGYTTTVTTNDNGFPVPADRALAVEWVLNNKPAHHETPTLYILTTLPPVPGTGSVQGAATNQYTTEQGAIGNPLAPTIVFGTRLPVPAAIPEPGTFLLMGTGLACLVAQVLRRKSKV